MLENKVGMIFGVANKRSIAWACAQSCVERGAKLAFTYQGERLQSNIEKLTADIEDTHIRTTLEDVDTIATTGQVDRKQRTGKPGAKQSHMLGHKSRVESQESRIPPPLS